MIRQIETKRGKIIFELQKNSYNPKYLRIVKFKLLILFFLSFLSYQIDFQFILQTSFAYIRKCQKTKPKRHTHT